MRRLLAAYQEVRNQTFQLVYDNTPANFLPTLAAFLLLREDFALLMFAVEGAYECASAGGGAPGCPTRGAPYLGLLSLGRAASEVQHASGARRVGVPRREVHLARGARCRCGRAARPRGRGGARGLAPLLDKGGGVAGLRHLDRGRAAQRERSPLRLSSTPAQERMRPSASTSRLEYSSAELI